MVAFPLQRFLNQTCQYQAFTGVDNRDDPSYAAATPVACRFVEDDREHYAGNEDVRQSRTKVMLAFQPVLRSLINGREVVRAMSLVQVGGTTPGWTAVLR